MHSKRGPGVAKIRRSGKMVVTTSNRPVADKGGSLGQKGLKTDLHWARILVKMNSNRKPAFVNLLTGARSYKLQIWWEI